MGVITAIFVNLSVSVHLTFNGEWTDDTKSGLGYSTFICVDGNQLYGAYSEIGIFQGTVRANGMQASGNWYQAGGNALTHYPVNTGTFSLTLLPDGSGFSGSWNNGTRDVPWVESRVSTVVPNGYQCARLFPVETVGGYWQNVAEGSHWEICVNSQQKTYNSSFYEPSVGQGEENGLAYNSNQVISGYYQSRATRGINLAFVYFDGTLGNYWWTMPAGNATIGAEDYNNPARHGVGNWKYGDVPSVALCLENRGVRFVAYDYYSNSASTLAIGMFTILLGVM